MPNFEESEARIPITVLVVEDDEALNRLIQKTLQRADFRTEGALNGVDAIAKAVKHPNTILLLDYILSDMTGWEVIATLAERRCSVPFIVMTGHGAEKVAVEMMKLGARDYLVKDPGFVNILPQLVRKVCDELDKEKSLVRTKEALQRLEHLLSKSQSPIY
jgi:DNA-binding NtrC family response regulator